MKQRDSSMRGLEGLKGTKQEKGGGRKKSKRGCEDKGKE